MTQMNGHQATHDAQELTAKQALVLEELVGGSSVVAAAKKLKLNESTIRRWQKLPHFVKAHQAARDDLFHQVMKSLQRQSLIVLDKHLKAIVEPTPASQMKAVQIINAELLMREKVDELETKLDELARLLERTTY